MRDEINEPLGKAPATSTRLFGKRSVAGLTAIAIGMLGLGVAISVLRGTRVLNSNEPIALARIEMAPTAPPEAHAAAQEGTAAFASGEQVEKASGVKVTRVGGGGPPGALIIDIPQALAVRLAPAPDARLVEKSKYGELPRIGQDGARPSEVYARPVVETAKLRGAPKVAILVGGLGLDGTTTRTAIARLPPAVSLGFAPYGEDLRNLAASAREAGHEILLQAPMEGFGEISSGQRTLHISATEADNRDDLRWMMSRFSGFVGVENYLGAKLTSDSKAFAPVLAEVGSRGLLYLDDGSSPRSLTASLSQALNLRAGEADIVIDAIPTPEQIEIALSKLETLARRQGGAIGVATALPVSLDHLTRWAEALEARGIALTPVSAMIGRSPMRSADTSR